MSASRILVTGLVQGVFFRVEAKEKADALGLTGWVRNTEDGAVEIHVEGPEEHIQAFEAWCRLGPPAARVDLVASEKTKPEGHPSFDVRV